MQEVLSKRNEYWRLTIAVGLNAPLVTLILLRNVESLQFDVLSWIYFIAVSLGYYLLGIYLIASVSYLVLCSARTVAFGMSGLVIAAAVYYLLIDSYAFSIINMHVDLFWLEWVLSDFEGFGLAPGTLRSALIALLVLVAIEVGIVAVSRRATYRGRYFAACSWGLLVLLFGVSQGVHAVAYEKNDARVTGLTPRLPFYLPVTSHRNAARYGNLLPIGENELPQASADRNTSLHYPLREIESRAIRETDTPNIVIIFLESWRGDMLNDSVTPHINSLARKSTVCLNHYSSGNATVTGVFGFFYGLHPTYWPAVKSNNAAIHNPVLIDVLEDYHYAFGIYAKSNFKRHKIKDAVFRDIAVHEDFAGETAVEQDADMNGQLISFLRERKRTGEPFMAFAFYKANHAPYRYPAADTLFRPSGDQDMMHAGGSTDPTLYLNDYRNATRYVDGLVGDVLREMDSLGFMNNTLVIVTTDHGEEFNDNKTGCWGHGSNYTQYQTHVPLVLYAPGRTPLRIERVTAHVDIVPTLLEEFLGCLNPAAEYSNGRNLYADRGDARPLVIGSYVNHAFVVGGNVFEVNPLYVRDYQLTNVGAEASPPSADMMMQIAAEMGQFLDHAGPRICREP